MSIVTARLVAALRAEYVNGVAEAVGVFLDAEPNPNFELADQLEDRVREAADPECELRDIEQELNLAQMDHESCSVSDDTMAPELRQDIQRIDDAFFIERATKPSACPTALEKFIRGEGCTFRLVGCMEGFVVSGMGQGNMQQVFAATMRRFRWLLYGDGSVRSADVCRSLRDHLTFCCGSMCDGLEELEELMELKHDGVHDMYCMSMKCDEWPFNPSWNGMFPAAEVQGFCSSCWRPQGMCAVWEETFHTITEAFNRLGRTEPQYADWGFGEGSHLGCLMQADIDAGGYDTEEQNKAEGGEYDFETAVNEYVHQCWLVHYAGHKSLLTGPKAQVMQLMERTPGMPLREY